MSNLKTQQIPQVPKIKTIFDLVNDLTINKVHWRDQSESDRKKFQPYMIHRILSMNPDYVDLIASIQPVIGDLSPQICYDLYLDLLPKSKFYSKYISGKGSGKYAELVDFYLPKLQCNKSEVEEMIEMVVELGALELLRSEIKSFGYDDKALKKEFKI